MYQYTLDPYTFHSIPDCNATGTGSTSSQWRAAVPGGGWKHSGGGGTAPSSTSASIPHHQLPHGSQVHQGVGTVPQALLW